MKKFIIILIALMFLATSAQAGGFWKGLFVKEGEPLKAEPAPAFNTILGGLPFNLEGDTIYLIDGESFGAGVGVDIATYKGLLTLRGEVTSTNAADTSIFAGTGLMLNIPTLLSLIPGVTWNASYINPSIGVVPGWDFGSDKFDVGVVLSIIQVTF